jgi:CheY-like chemotaxis protein
LASAFVIARKHGGTLEVGDSPGGGATFTLELPRIAPPALASTDSVTTAGARTASAPLAVPDLPPATAAVPVPSRPRVPLLPPPVIEIPEDTSTWLDGLAVLVVEDDPQLSTLLTRFLTAAGATVHAIDNGEDAVTYLREASTAGTALDVVVTDLRMPRGSGAGVIAAAREREVPLPIVVMSGYLDDPVVAALASRRVLHFLAKPFAERQLYQAIAVAQRYAESAVRG